jgi:hypothetical protein
MKTRRCQRIRRGTAEQLLHGGPVPVPDPLARLLASAAAPPQPGELAREDTAVAAFHAARLGPVAASRREQMVTPPLARLLTTKIAALALVLCTTGGIALAATMTGSSPHRSGPAPGPARAREGRAAPATARSRPAKHEAAHLSGLGAASARPRHAGPAAVPVTMLCLTLAGDVHALLTARPGTAARPPASAKHGGTNAGQRGGPQSLDARERAQAIASPVLRRSLAHPAFAGLATAAGGAANVPDLCALALGVPAPPAPQRLASLPVSGLAAVRVAALARQPCWVLARLPAAALARLPVPVLATLPRSVVAGLPAPTMARLPLPLLAKLPAVTLGRLPGPVLAKFPVPVLRRLPATALARLPAGVLATLPAATLARLPGSVLARLPVPVLRRLPAAALARLPVHVLAKLPVAILRRLPAWALAKLPPSVLAKLPRSVQARLPAYARARLAATELNRVPAPALAKLPVSVLARLPAPVLASLPAAVLSLLPPTLLATVPNGR